MPKLSFLNFFLFVAFTLVKFASATWTSATFFLYCALFFSFCTSICFYILLLYISVVRLWPHWDNVSINSFLLVNSMRLDLGNGGGSIPLSSWISRIDSIASVNLDNKRSICFLKTSTHTKWRSRRCFGKELNSCWPLNPKLLQYMVLDLDETARTCRTMHWGQIRGLV